GLQLLGSKCAGTNMGDRTGGGLPAAGQQPEERRLSSPIVSNEAENRTGTQRHVDAAENRSSLVVIGHVIGILLRHGRIVEGHFVVSHRGPPVDMPPMGCAYGG